MSHTVNEATGEVTVTLDGETFKLKATFGRMADLETAMGQEGLPVIFAALQKSGQKTITHALRCLCISGNEAKVRDLLMPRCIGDATAAILAAITIGWSVDVPEGEVQGTAATLN